MFILCPRGVFLVNMLLVCPNFAILELIIDSDKIILQPIRLFYQEVHRLILFDGR